MWECGGGSTNTGSAKIICDMNGKAKKPIYIRRRGSLCNDNHALIPVRENDVVIEVFHHRGDFDIDVYQITSIKDDDTAIAKQINSFNRGEWDYPLEGDFRVAVSVAMEKAQCYHCRCAMYIAE